LEPVSVDEAYLDLTHWLPAGQTPKAAACEIREEICRKTGLTCSIGVATGKAIAKMASDLRKPDALVIVPPGEDAAFLAPLPIGKLRGVGAATERRLRDLGVNTIGDLARMPESFLEKRFGIHGRGLWELARGIDDSPVTPEREAKSIGRETTFPVDIASRDLLERTLLELAEDVTESLRRYEFLAKGVTLKLRYEDFSTLTRSLTLAEPADVTEPVYNAARDLLRAVNPTRPVRLIGVTAGPLLPAGARQLSLFADAPSAKERKIAAAMDAIRARFGGDAIKRARLAKQEGKGDGAD
jgi:DNA polymerase-4